MPPAPRAVTPFSRHHATADNLADSILYRRRAMHREFALPGTRPRWAPDRVVDIQHLALELAVDPAKRGITGTVTLRVAVIAPDTRSVELDAVELEIERVTVGGAAAGFSHD